MSFVETPDRIAFAADKMRKVNLFESDDLFCDLYCLEPGQSQNAHAHPDATKFYYVIEGAGEFLVGQSRTKLRAGGLAFALPGQTHGVENTSGDRLVLLVTMAPNPNRRA